jgi:hypothetical protein
MDVTFDERRTFLSGDLETDRGNEWDRSGDKCISSEDRGCVR